MTEQHILILYFPSQMNAQDFHQWMKKEWEENHEDKLLWPSIRMDRYND